MRLEVWNEIWGEVTDDIHAPVSLKTGSLGMTR
jgi:hypothetical protein